MQSSVIPAAPFPTQFLNSCHFGHHLTSIMSLPCSSCCFIKFAPPLGETPFNLTWRSSSCWGRCVFQWWACCGIPWWSPKLLGAGIGKEIPTNPKRPCVLQLVHRAWPRSFCPRLCCKIPLGSQRMLLEPTQVCTAASIVPRPFTNSMPLIGEIKIWIFYYMGTRCLEKPYPVFSPAHTHQLFRKVKKSSTF